MIIRKNLLLINFLILMCITSCDRNIEVFITVNHNVPNKRVLELKHYEDSIVLKIKNEYNEQIFSELLKKAKDRYYKNLYFEDGFCEKKDSKSIVLSLDENYHEIYDCEDGRHELYIIKLSDGNYQSVENVYGIVSYANIYYYDKKFKILKVIQKLGENMFEYVNQDNPDYHIKEEDSQFIINIKKDSVEYMSHYFKIQ